MRKMPKQKPRRSNQIVGTPTEFLAAVERRLGPLCVDLAANKNNAKCTMWLGPDGKHEDALADDVRWDHLWTPGGVLFCNPPYADINPWAEKANLTGLSGARLALLVPASVGSTWYSNHIHRRAHVWFIQPRLSFDGIGPYPKDVMLAVWNPPRDPGGLVPNLFEVWNWKTGDRW